MPRHDGRARLDQPAEGVGVTGVTGEHDGLTTRLRSTMLWKNSALEAANGLTGGERAQGERRGRRLVIGTGQAS